MNLTHNIALAFELDGLLCHDTLAASLSELADRHETLRTSLNLQDGRPTQLVDMRAVVPLRNLDLSKDPAPDDSFDYLVSQEMRSAFTLSRYPLWRSTLVKMVKDRHVLLMTLSHVIADAWSIAVIYRDLTRIYQANLLKQTATLPAMQVQFGDYAAWERRLSNEPAERAWRDMLSPLPPRPDVPGRIAIGQDKFEMAETRLPSVSGPLVARLVDRCRDDGITLSNLLVSAAARAMAPHVENEVTLGVYFANRHRLEVQPLVGPVSDVLPIKLDLSENQHLFDLALQVRNRIDAVRKIQIPSGLVETTMESTLDCGDNMYDIAVDFMPFWRPPRKKVRTDNGDVMTWSVRSLGLSLPRQRGQWERTKPCSVTYVVHGCEDGGLSCSIYANECELSEAAISILGTQFLAALTEDQ